MSGAQVAADLRAAAEVLRRDGWTQGQYGTPDGPKCMAGALRLVTGEGSSQLSRYIDSCNTVRLVIRPEGNLPYWNDEPGRTADEVIAALLAAADAAEATS